MMFHFYKRLAALRNEYFNELDNTDLKEIGDKLNHNNDLSSEYLIRYMKNWSDSMNRRNAVDLNNASLEQIRKALEERGQQRRFMADEERDKVLDILNDYSYGWFYDDVTDAIQMMKDTIFGYNVRTDSELLECCKEYVENHDPVDEDSDPKDIFMANLVARCELEKALEL